MNETDAARERDAARLRSRLWGATVLIAVAVIGLPLLLDGAGSESRFRRVERLREEPPRILGTDAPAGETGRVSPDVSPDAPETASDARRASDEGEGPDIRIGEDDPPDYLREPPRADAPGAPAAALPTTALRRSSADDARGVLRAWVVQAGSFREQVNALAVRDRLRRAGYPSFVTDTSARGGQDGPGGPDDVTPEPLYRVQVGPLVDAARAERTRVSVVALLGREAIIVPYP